MGADWLEEAAARMAVRVADAVMRSGSSLAGAAEACALLRQHQPAASGASRSEAFARLVDGLILDPFDIDLLILAGLGEERPSYGEALRRLHPREIPYPSVSLAELALAPAPRLRYAIEAGAAVSGGAIRFPPEGALGERTLMPAERLWPLLHGVDVWPAGAKPLPDEPALFGLEEWLAEPEVAEGVALLAAGEHATVVVTADEERVAVHRGAALVRAAGRLGAQLAAAPTPEWELLVMPHLAARGAVPVVRAAGAEGESGAAAEPPRFAALRGPVVVCARPGVRLRGDRAVLTVYARQLRSSERRRMWSLALPELAEQAPALAARYAVEPSIAAQAAVDARAAAARVRRAVAASDVAASVRARAGAATLAGIKVVRPTAGWDSLVLPANRLAQLHEAVQRLERQAQVLDDWGFLAGRPGARGVRVLLAGPPGTGKTLSAEVLARELDVDLLVVDLSRVVSKWLGETEKNLARVFDAAEQSAAVLLFDEADALFGKRTAVSNAHDRYANLETAYLLSRLERFEGLAILSTNLRKEIDAAFSRRLDVVVEYFEPGVAERSMLWRRHVPSHAPTASDVNFDELAQTFPVVGGIIRNAALGAAFLASTEGTSIARRHFFHAMRREYDKMGQQFPEMG